MSRTVYLNGDIVTVNSKSEIADSILILKALSAILYEFGKGSYGLTFVQCALIILFLYAGYFAVTYYSRRSLTTTTDPF